MVAETAAPAEDDADRFHQAQCHQDTRLAQQNMIRVLQIDGLQREHTELAGGEHAKVERVEIEQNLVR